MAVNPSKTSIRYGSNLPKQRARYDFFKLKKTGDFFEVIGEQANWPSLRTQASKQAKKRGVVYSVTRVAKTPLAKKPGVIVRFERYVT